MFAHTVNAHISLRLLQQHHAHALFRVTDANRDYLRQWLPWLDGVQCIADTEAFIVKSLHLFAESGAFVCGVWRDQKLCGVVGYNYIDWSEGTGQLGYWLAEADTGRGIVTACCRAIISHAFQEYGLHTVSLAIATQNYRSRAVAERLGFRRTGVKHNAEWLYDHFVDHALYALHRPQPALHTA